MLDIDPLNNKLLSYDQFHKNLSRLIKLTWPEVYVLFKACIVGEKLNMKEFFKLLGGAA